MPSRTRPACFPLIWLAAAACATPNALLQPSSEDWTEVRNLARQAVEEDGIVGLSVAVTIDGELVFAEGFGHADIRRTLPATKDTVYDIASVGKQFTAAAVLRIVEEGGLRLDDRIRDVVPETPDHFPDVSLYELLHHTSGFVAGDMDELSPPPGLDRPRFGLEVLDDVALQQGSVLFPASETWMYCNSGYLLLGVAVEAASGMRYADFIQTRLLHPAGITGMTVCERPPKPRMADSIHRSEEGLSLVPLIDMSVYAGQGSVCSSVVDLALWQAALEDHRVLGASSFRSMCEPARIHGSVQATDVPYGKGLRLGSLYGHPKRGHTGTYEGGSAALAHYPEDRLTIAVLSNTCRGGTPHARQIEARIATRLLGLDGKTNPSPQPITPEQRSMLTGVYVNPGGSYEVTFQGDELCTVHEGKIIERLIHVGDLHFLHPEIPAFHFWFEMDGDRAGWWILESHGFLWAVYRRRPAETGSTESNS